VNNYAVQIKAYHRSWDDDGQEGPCYIDVEYVVEDLVVANVPNVAISEEDFDRLAQATDDLAKIHTLRKGRQVNNDNEFHDVIVSSMESAGLEPIEFEKPLKSVYALYKYHKRIEPSSLVERHAAVGWGLGNLIEHFGKELWSVKSLSLHNEQDSVTIEAVVCHSGLTFEEDHVAWLDKLAAFSVGEDYKAWGYFYGSPPMYCWDSVERISDVKGATQIRGDGRATGKLNEERGE